uniref:Transcription initiation factor IIA subunit 1 n=1 Tax=Arion vulgaris TaxID=1028688 RepID=A0A0B6Y7L2_9EUPU
MSTASQVSKLYHTVVDDVINNVKEAFLDEGVDEQVLQELKQLWEGKLAASKALEPPPSTSQEVIAPQNVTVMLPQAIHTSQEQGVLGQPGHHQSTTQYQLTPSTGTATISLPAGLFQHQLAALGAGGQIQNITVQQTGNGQYITLAGIPSQQLPQLQHSHQQQLSQHITPQMLQQQMQSKQQIRLPQQSQTKLLQAGQIQQQNPTTLAAQVRPAGGVHRNLIQTDGTADTSSSDDDFDDDDKEDDDKEEEAEEEEQGEEEDPLNSGDDVSEEDPTELFDTDNVVVCQYDKINRNKNKWKFHLKDGIMNLNGRDLFFRKLQEIQSGST